MAGSSTCILDQDQGSEVEMECAPPVSRNETKATTNELHSNILIRLNIRGDRRKVVRVRTLSTRSRFFALQLSRINFQSSTTTRDESSLPEFFIDAPPDGFEGLLHYLADGVMPLLWTARSGFDIKTYASMAALASTYELPDNAQAWLQSAKWEHAIVQTMTRITVPPRMSATADVEADLLGGFSKGDIFSVEHISQMETQFVCPRGLQHHNRDESCGEDQMCVNRTEGTGWVERISYTTVLLLRRTKIDWTVLRLDG